MRIEYYNFTNNHNKTQFDLYSLFQKKQSEGRKIDGSPKGKRKLDLD